jgi:hypothetical protein
MSHFNIQGQVNQKIVLQKSPLYRILQILLVISILIMLSPTLQDPSIVPSPQFLGIDAIAFGVLLVSNLVVYWIAARKITPAETQTGNEQWADSHSLYVQAQDIDVNESKPIYKRIGIVIVVVFLVAATLALFFGR